MPKLPSPADHLRHHGIRADKRLGQHFLLEPRHIEPIASYAGDLRGRHVIEIGPGPGALTRALLAYPIASLHAVELDARFIPLLEEIRGVSEGRLQIHHQDALTLTLESLCPAPRMVVANLPYNVATPLLMGWLEQLYHHGPGLCESMVLMFQKEVTDRLAATPGSKAYGRLSVMTQWLCHVDICQIVPPEAFDPPPKVDSAVVRIVPRETHTSQLPFNAMSQLLAQAFNQRRKMLRKALNGWHPDAVRLLEHAEIDPTRRAETLSIVEFERLAALGLGGA